MSTLRELQKLACLQSLGLQLLVAKRPLPGAAPSVPSVDIGNKVPGPAPAIRPQVAEARGPEAGIPAFHLAAVVAGGCLWLEPLAGPELEQEPLQLIRAMAFALQRKPESPQVTRFDWPLHSNRQLDLSAGAAAAALTGFVLRQVQDRRCRALVLLGQAAGEHLQQPELDAVPIVLLPATAELLAHPQCKREAWQALAALGF